MSLGYSTPRLQSPLHPAIIMVRPRLGITRRNLRRGFIHATGLSPFGCPPFYRVPLFYLYDS